MNIDSMIQGNPPALVTSYNGVLVADSLEVADRFGSPLLVFTLRRPVYICVTVPVRINALWFLFQRVQKYRTTDTTQAITVQNGCISRLHLTVCSTQALAVRHI